MHVHDHKVGDFSLQMPESLLRINCWSTRQYVRITCVQYCTVQCTLRTVQCHKNNTGLLLVQLL